MRAIHPNNRKTGFQAYHKDRYLCDVPAPSSEGHDGFMKRFAEVYGYQGEEIDIYANKRWISTYDGKTRWVDWSVRFG